MMHPGGYRGVTVTPLEAGVDWLRLSAKTGHHAGVLLEFGSREAQRLIDGGDELKRWSWNGYIGHQIGKLVFGERQDGAYCQVTGSAAHAAFLRAPVTGMRSSRLDVQVVCVLPKPDKELHEYAYQETHRWRAVNPRTSYPVLSRRTEDPEGGTLYVGKRGGQGFGRLYDKHAESQGEYPAGAWRWETQSENETATSWFHMLKVRPDTTSACGAVVRSWFSGRGVPVMWTQDAVVEVPTYRRAKTENEAKLEWLKKSVAPSVAKLIAAGYSREVMLALFDKVPVE